MLVHGTALQFLTSLHISITEIQKVLIYRGGKFGITEGMKKCQRWKPLGTNVYQNLLQFVIYQFRDNLEKSHYEMVIKHLPLSYFSKDVVC